jgi:hypothetical protein
MEKKVKGTNDPWVHRSVMMKCPTCMYAVFATPTAAVGRCRRRSPSMQGYPAIYREDWCGDHKIGKSE